MIAHYQSGAERPSARGDGDVGSLRDARDDGHVLARDPGVAAGGGGSHGRGAGPMSAERIGCQLGCQLARSSAAKRLAPPAEAPDLGECGGPGRGRTCDQEIMSQPPLSAVLARPNAGGTGAQLPLLSARSGPLPELPSRLARPWLARRGCRLARGAPPRRPPSCPISSSSSQQPSPPAPQSAPCTTAGQQLVEITPTSTGSTAPATGCPRSARGRRRRRRRRSRCRGDRRRRSARGGEAGASAWQGLAAPPPPSSSTARSSSPAGCPPRAV
jgi:hypothetical protein